MLSSGNSRKISARILESTYAWITRYRRRNGRQVRWIVEQSIRAYYMDTVSRRLKVPAKDKSVSQLLSEYHAGIEIPAGCFKRYSTKGYGFRKRTRKQKWKSTEQEKSVEERSSRIWSDRVPRWCPTETRVLGTVIDDARHAELLATATFTGRSQSRTLDDAIRFFLNENQHVKSKSRRLSGHLYEPLQLQLIKPLEEKYLLRIPDPGGFDVLPSDAPVFVDHLVIVLALANPPGEDRNRFNCQDCRILLSRCRQVEKEIVVTDGIIRKAWDLLRACTTDEKQHRMAAEKMKDLLNSNIKVLNGSSKTLCHGLGLSCKAGLASDVAQDLAILRKHYGNVFAVAAASEEYLTLRSWVPHIRAPRSHSTRYI